MTSGACVAIKLGVGLSNWSGGYLPDAVEREGFLHGSGNFHYGCAGMLDNATGEVNHFPAEGCWIAVFTDMRFTAIPLECLMKIKRDQHDHEIGFVHSELKTRQLFAGEVFDMPVC